MKTNESLEDLEVAKNNITDAGLKALLESIDGHPRLRAIGLRGNKISDECHIGQVIQRM